MLGLAFLVQRQAQYHQHQTEQNQAFVQISQHQIEAACRQQQHEHGLLQGLAHDGAQGAALIAG